MKKILTVVLLVLLMGLCAHGVATPEWETTPHPTRTTESITETTEESVSTATIITDKNDPLTNVAEEYLALYNEILTDSSRYMSPPYYFLYDIDSNGKKELLLGEEWGGDFFLTSIYAIQDGVAVEQEGVVVGPIFGPPALLFKNGTIKMDFDMGTIIHYYQFENGELKCKIMLLDDYSPDTDTGECYRKDGQDDLPKVITKAEFDRLKNEFEGDGQTVELDWKPLAEYGR